MVLAWDYRWDSLMGMYEDIHRDVNMDRRPVRRRGAVRERGRGRGSYG